MIKFFKNYLKKRLLIGIEKNRNNFNQEKLFELQKNLLKLEFKNNFLDNYILGDFNDDDLNNFINQTYCRLIRENLYKTFNFCTSYKISLIYPFLPLNSLKEIENFGISVNYKASAFLQKIFFLYKFFELIILTFLFIPKIKINLYKHKTRPENSVFIDEINNLFISKKNLLINKNVFKRYIKEIDFFYSNKDLNIKNIKKIDFFPKIDLKNYIKFLISSFKIINNFKKYNFFIKCKSDELVLTNYFKYTHMNSIFFNILFSENSRINKPLWTYFLENKNWNIIYYNFSTNQSDEIKFYPKNYLPGEFKYFSFKKCVFSNKELLDYHIKKSKNISHDYFIHDEQLFKFKDFFRKNSLNKFVVSVFDTVIYDKSIYGNIPRPYWYYEKKNIINFYRDVLENLNTFNNLLIVIKRKNKDLNSKKLIVDSFPENFKNRIFFVDNVNTPKLIMYSDLVISIPFSTPSMIAEINKIDSIVYDSSNKLTNYLVGREIKFVNNKNKFLLELNNIFQKN